MFKGITTCIVSFVMLFPYLSSAPPELQFSLLGSHSGVRQLTGSMGLSPLRGSHRAARESRTEVSLSCDVSLLYAGSYPALTGQFPLGSRKTVMAFTAAVALHHRFVPDECIFICKGASDFSARNNSVVTNRILSKKQPFAVAAARLLW